MVLVVAGLKVVVVVQADTLARAETDRSDRCILVQALAAVVREVLDPTAEQVVLEVTADLAETLVEEIQVLVMAEQELQAL